MQLDKCVIVNHGGTDSVRHREAIKQLDCAVFLAAVDGPLLSAWDFVCSASSNSKPACLTHVIIVTDEALTQQITFPYAGA